MKRITFWQPGLIAAIALIALYNFFPTARYLTALAATAPEGETSKAQHEEKLEELRKSAIPLGLDLRGGVDVSLMIDQDEAMKTSVQNVAAALKNDFDSDKISAAVGVSQDGKSLLIKALDKSSARSIANVLSNVEKPYMQELEGSFTQEQFESLEDVQVALRPEVINDNLNKNIQGAMKIVRQRLDAFGLTQPSISIQGGNRIRVQVAGEKDPDKLIANLTRLATMEFRLSHELYGAPNDPIQDLLDAEKNLKPDAQVPLGYEVVPFKFGRTDPKTGKIEYEEGKMLVEREVKIKGSNLRNTGVSHDPLDLANPIKVTLQFDDAGREAFAKMTTESAAKFDQDGRPRNLAILIDGVVRSAPHMKVSITGGNAVIEGGFRQEDAQDLSLLLKAGALDAPLIVETKNTVGASLGTESIFGGVKALVFGTLAVMAFMSLYYGMAGVIAIFAVFLNVLIILAIMALANATMTLSGIGGILLTVGMAVDANVLIYERMREELEAGRPLKQAISLGFDRAFSVILDSNLTTLIASLILLQFTEGSVFGFALTMSFGLVANLYTGLTVTYTLCALWFQWRNSLNLGKLRIFVNTMYDFIKIWHITLIGSWGIILTGLAWIFLTGGLRFGVDFAGGLLAEVTFTQPADEGEIRTAIREAGFQGERVQNKTGTNSYIIRVKDLEMKGAKRADSAQDGETLLKETLTNKYGQDGFTVDRFTSFGPETGQEFRSMALTVIFLASIGIGFYLWVRFELIFGIAAVIALIHDILMTAVWSQVWGVEITLDSVAAMMVLLGFSVNDTIVIFDRIRENNQRTRGKTFREICNLSINQSLARTFITTGTVLLVVLVMLLIGGEGLEPFSKVLFIGCLTGVYSTAFIATPIVFWWNQRSNNKLMTDLAEKKPVGPEAAQDPMARTKGTARRAPRRRGV